MKKTFPKTLKTTATTVDYVDNFYAL